MRARGMRRLRGTGVGGDGTGKEGTGVGLRERVRVASPRAADWPSARAPAPRPARAPSPWAPLLAPGGGYGLARPGGEGGSAGGSRVLGAGGPSRSWKRVFCLLFSTPCAWSCRFQEEELRGTSRGSGAARGAGLSSAPSLLAFPRLPWLSRSLECLQRTGGGGGGRCPGPRAAGRPSRHRSYRPPPASLLRL